MIGYCKQYRAPVSGNLIVAFLGDSITFGSQPSYPFDGHTYAFLTGYRHWVYAGLVALGMSPQMVGYHDDFAEQGNPPSMAGQFHSGFPGTNGVDWTTGLFTTVKNAINAQVATGPHVVVLMLGANDTNDSGGANRCLAVVDLALAAWPKANVLVCSRTPQLSSGVEIPSGTINALIAAGAAARARCRFVDAYAAVQPTLPNVPDGLHLSAQADCAVGGAILAGILGL